MSKASKVFRIPDHISIKIAAGEVIETPASIVKELVENSIDAGADSIAVEIAGGGKRSIRVKDNGSGMTEEDALLALQRFTTSKLNISDALLEDIDTLGFRGEALASIASVSHLALTTKTKNSETATHIYAEGSKIIEQSRTAAPQGTSIEVKNIFYNFPARRKFLRKDKTEEGKVENLFARLALPHLNTNFSLTSNNKRILEFKKNEAMTSRIRKIFPKSSFPDVQFSHRAGNHSVEGIITSQGIDFPTSANVIIYVNSRLIRDRIITHALLEALRTHISSGRYPGGAVFIKIPPEEVDVNVHPTKSEVKFKDPNFMHGLVRESALSAFKKKASAPRAFHVKDTEPEVYTPFLSDVTSKKSKRVQTSAGFQRNVGDLKRKKDCYFAGLDVLGQLKNSYIICGDERGVIIIDQHAAHERVTFENLKTGIKARSLPAQSLLFPIEFELKGSGSSLLKEKISEFKEYGFTIEEFGPNSFILRTVPEILVNTDHVKTIEDILEVMQEFKSASEKEKIVDEILETMACHSSVRFAKSLTHAEIHSLLVQLDDLESAQTCPHGRPFMVALDELQLRKMFKRT